VGVEEEEEVQEVAAFAQVVQKEGTATVMEEEGRGEQVEEGSKGG